MGQSLTEIARTLENTNKKIQLIYAFNGTGKTRLSHEFKKLISRKETEKTSDNKIIYYNAFTEDLFYWDNDLNFDTNRKLIIQPNNFTNWLFEEQGQDGNIISHFQHYTSTKLTPRFNQKYTTKNAEGKNIEIKAYSEITFSIQGGNDDIIDNIKISKGEESILIWCIFYSLLELVVNVLNVPELDDRETDQFNNLEYIFIDDPVTSLDDTHLIEVAVNLADLLKSSESDLKFIITTHNPLFYNILFNEFNNKKSSYKPKHCQKKYLEKLDDETFNLHHQSSDSPFSYHLFLLSKIENAIELDQIHKYHFNFLRNILEKTSTFLGYKKWKDLLPKESRKEYYERIINFSSHYKISSEEGSIIKNNDKKVLKYLIKELKKTYKFNSI